MAAWLQVIATSRGQDVTQDRYAENTALLKANIPVFLLRSLILTLRDLGISTDSLTLGLGFSPADLEDPGCRISFRQGREMILRAQRLAGGRALGLETGTRETVTSIGLVGYAMTTCATVGEAISLGLELQRDAGSMLVFHMETGQGVTSLSGSSRFPDPQIHPFLVEEAFASFMQIARDLIGEDFRPSRVDLSYPAPAYAEEYRRVFGCEVRFSQLASTFSYDASWHELPLRSADVLNHRQVLSFLAQSRSRNRESEEIIETVERALRQRLEARPSAREVAQMLCMSERTLRRRLSESGVSYSHLLERMRKDRAQELLVNRSLTVEQIAYAVGFADPHNFHRAFRRWTGKTPGALRKEMQIVWPPAEDEG